MTFNYFFPFHFLQTEQSAIFSPSGSVTGVLCLEQSVNVLLQDGELSFWWMLKVLSHPGHGKSVSAVLTCFSFLNDVSPLIQELPHSMKISRICTDDNIILARCFLTERLATIPPFPQTQLP